MNNAILEATWNVTLNATDNVTRKTTWDVTRNATEIGIDQELENE